MKSSISVSKFHTYTGHSDCVYTLCALDDQRFFSSGGDGQVVLWDLVELNKGTILAKIPSSVYALHYDQSADILIIGQNHEGIHLVDVGARVEKGSLKVTEAPIFDIQTDNRCIYLATGEGELVVIAKEDLTIRKRIKTTDENARAINLDDHRIIVGYSDNRIRVFDKLHFTLMQEIDSHSNSVFSLATDKKSGHFLSGSRDAHLKIWDLDTMNLKEDIVAHMYAINSIAFRGDMQFFATCSMDKSIKIWDAGRLKLKKVIDRARHAGHGTSVNKLLWMRHKNLLVSCSDDRTISVWDINFKD